MWRPVVGICVLLAGCGRANFDPIGVGDAPPSGTGDTGDTGGIGDTDCWSAWTTGPLRLSTPRLVNELMTNSSTGDPLLSPDAHTLYFVRGSSTKDYYVTRRRDRLSPWGTPELLTDLSSAQDDTKLSLTADGLIAILSSDRTPASSYDLWEATRDSTTVAFGAATRTTLALLNTASSQYDPHVSGDGLRLYYAPLVGGTQAVRFASRPARGMAFGTPVPLALANDFSADPSLSPDELVLVYSAGENTMPSMFYTTRATTSDPFSTGTQLPLYDVPAFDQDPVISYDGCELYFASRRGGQLLQLYVTFVE